MPMRRGVTLIELLVLLGILALLTALALPAVQAAREAARRAACASNLRQLALAVGQYEAQYGVMPAISGWPQPPGDPRIPSYQKQYGVFPAILPGLDETVLFNAINFESDLWDPYIAGECGSVTVNRTAMATVLKVLLCPSDPTGTPGWTGPTNYRANMGVALVFTDRNSRYLGPFSHVHYVSTAAIGDGLSQTVALSEKLIGRLGGPLDRRAGMIRDRGGWTIDEVIEGCRRQSGTSAPYYNTAGLTWFPGDLSQTMYNHALVPNAPLTDCFSPGVPLAGLFSARSNHPGGVQAANADGSVRFIRNSIDQRLWQGLGTRGGGEIIDLAALP
jgi:type II secretory pathway pseudopilin PulG